MRKGRTRTGFTIVELLVAAAMTMFLMYIIGYALQSSVGIFRTLRATGVMQEKLMSSQMVLKRDLSAEHFSGTFAPGFGGPYVRDQRLDRIGWTPPDEGFFRIINGYAPGAGVDSSWYDGTDPDGLYSYIGLFDSLHFTVKLHGNRDEEMFYANAGGTLSPPSDFNFGGQFASRWAEVYYFLQPNQQSANGVPLYTLYRRQRVALPNSGGTILWPPANQLAYPDISNNGTQVNNSTTLTDPRNRMQPSNPQPVWISAGYANWGPPTLAAIGTSAGDDILLTDVLSFEVKCAWNTGGASNLFNGTAYSGSCGTMTNPTSGNLDWPFDHLPLYPSSFQAIQPTPQFAQPAVFDTWSKSYVPATWNWNDQTTWAVSNPPTSPNTTPSPPLRMRVTTLQIRIRVWDVNAQQARQFTMIQEI